ncbi:hypothetical protein Kurepalu2_00004 [Pseudomonas phage vB_PpuP-Kurepalu-2]
MNALQQNRFILARAACLLVSAYIATIQEYREILPLNLRISKDAPDTFDKLKAGRDAGELVVSPEFSETAIYGGGGNISFRVFHDYGHLIYDKAFTTEQEVELARIQWADLKKHLPEGWHDICHTVYFADTVEQSLYEARTGQFPVDQKAFVLSHMAA